MHINFLVSVSMFVGMPGNFYNILNYNIHFCYIIYLLLLYLIKKIILLTNRFRLLPSMWCRRFSPWQPSVLCQWPSLGWCHRCTCYFSVCQVISSLDFLWVLFPSPSYLKLKCWPSPAIYTNYISSNCTISNWKELNRSSEFLVIN